MISIKVGVIFFIIKMNILIKFIENIIIKIGEIEYMLLKPLIIKR